MSSKILKFLIVLSCQSLVSQNPVALPEVTLTALHVSDSLINAPASVGILNASDLQRINNVEIASAINRVPSVMMQSGSYNTNRISIRGIGARTPFGTNKIRAFYGNIPLTSGDSETTIEDLNLENLSRVEIIRGPLSSVYGAGLGGAIVISPQIPRAKDGAISIGSTHGSYGLMKTNIGVSVSHDKHGANVNYHRMESEGWRENSSYFREGVTISGEAFRTKDSHFNFLAGYTYLKAFIPSSITKEMFEESPSSAAPTWLAAKGFEQYKTWFGGIGYHGKLGNWENSTSVFALWKDSNEPRPFDILTEETTGMGARTQFVRKFKWRQRDADFILGGEIFQDRFSASTFENLYQQNDGNGSLLGERLSETQERRYFYNAFAQVRLPISTRLRLQGGFNLNQTNFTIDNRFPESDSEEHSYKPVFSSQLSLLYHLKSDQTIYLSGSRGFSLPAISETLHPDGSINSNIKPETGTNIEAGARSTFFNRKLFVQFSAFWMRVENLLVAKRIGDDQYVGVNAGSTIHRGFEADTRYMFHLGSFAFSGYASASWGNFRFDRFEDSGNDFSGRRLTGIPDASAAAGITVSLDRVYLGTDFYYLDKIPLNDANTEYVDAYRLLHLKVGYRQQIAKEFEMHLVAGVNNLFDEHYASMILPNATGQSPRYFYPGMPQNFYVNSTFRWNFQ